jgi:quercetin dioxygenase-like cupin family protein
MNTTAVLPDSLTVVGDRDGRLVRAGPAADEGRLDAQMFLSSQADNENTVMKAHYGAGVWSRWHSHPLGQILYILSGVCRVQREGGGVFLARPGDVVWLAPDEVHRHGADESGPMSYLSIQGVRGGAHARWIA